MSEDHTTGTIVLIHGLWLHTTSWDPWIERYQRRGYRVLAPAWPRMDVPAAELRANPAVLGGLGVTEIAAHYERIVRGLDAPPILVGHSLGGLLVQLLLDRGLGACGVAIHSAPVKGVLGLPLSSIRASFPVLRSPGNRHRGVGLTPAQFHYGFTNTVGAAESMAIYDRYHVPSPGRPLWQAATANLLRNPPTKVDLRNGSRAPLLFVAGGADHTVPASINRENHRRYRHSTAVTDFREYPGRAHYTLGLPGWEQVADDALDWASAHAQSHSQ